MKRKLALIAAIALGFMSPPIQADTTALQDFTPFDSSTRSFDGTIGFSFEFDTNVTLDSLGLYNTLTTASNNEVAIFSSDGTLLASSLVAVPANTSGSFSYSSTLTLSSGFNGILTSGTTYIIGSGAGGAAGGIPFVNDSNNSFTPGNHLTVISSMYGTGSSFAAPLVPFRSGDAYVGPNFTYSTASVPEPSTYVLILGGLGLLAGIVRLRRLNF